MPLRYIWTLRQDNTAVNIVTFYGDKINVELLNSTAHLSLTQFAKIRSFFLINEVYYDKKNILILPQKWWR